MRKDEKVQQELLKSANLEEVKKKCYNQEPVYFKEFISEHKKTDLAIELEEATEGKGKDLIT